MTTHDSFDVLTEGEHDAIARLWREGNGSGLAFVARYCCIRRAMRPRVGERLGCTEDALPRALDDQIAHMVLARAIGDNELQGSIPGELVAAIYYKGGGSVYLESYGRLCFCAAYQTKQPRPSARHASVCDELWKAYCQAVDALLCRAVETPRPGADRLCILDTTLIRIEGYYTLSPDRALDPALQRVVAAYLALDEQEVRRVWMPVSWQHFVPGLPVAATTITAALEDLQGALRQRGVSLFGTTVVFVVEDTTAAASMVSLALGLRALMGARPLILGVRWKEGAWQVVEPLPVIGPRERS